MSEIPNVNSSSKSNSDSKRTALYSKIHTILVNDNTIRSFTRSTLPLAKVAHLISNYYIKNGFGVTKNNSEILREIASVLEGNTAEAEIILNTVYKEIPPSEQPDSLSSTELVVPESPLPNAEDLVTGVPETTGGPVLVDAVPDVASGTSTEINSEELDKDAIFEKARGYASEMLQDRALIFDPRDLDEAVTTAKKDDVKNLEAFKGHVLHIANEAAKREEEKTRLEQAAKSSLERWEASIKSQHRNVQDYVQEQLDLKYNLPEGMIGVFDVQLGAYTMQGLANPKGTLRDELNMDAYSNPVFAILRNLDSEPIKAAVERSIKAMCGEDFTAQVNSIVETSAITIKGTLEEKRANLVALANNLPQLKDKTAPDNYKIWYLLTRGKDNSVVPDMTSKIYEQTQDAINHQARTETYMASGIPQTPAMDIAYRESVKDIEEEDAKKRGLLDATGHIIGTIASAPARCKKSIQDAMYESMGEFGKEWKANQEAAKERKQKLKEQKAQQKFELAQKELELKTQMLAQQNMQKIANRQNPNTGYGYGYGYGYGANNQGRYGRGSYGMQRGVNGVNFAPHIPMPVIATLVHIIVALICWLIFGNTKGIVIAVGLVIATAGLFSFKSVGSKAILFTIAGYVLAVLAMVLF